MKDQFRRKNWAMEGKSGDGVPKEEGKSETDVPVSQNVNCASSSAPSLASGTSGSPLKKVRRMCVQAL